MSAKQNGKTKFGPGWASSGQVLRAELSALCRNVLMIVAMNTWMPLETAD